MPELPSKIVARAVSADAEIFTSYYAVPGVGLIPINAFLLRAAEPVLVDTGWIGRSIEYFDAIRSAIDLRRLRWIWLTHDDADHIGCLYDLLEAAPDARLVTTFLGLGKLGLYGTAIPPERVFLLNPGQTLDVGDRRLLALRPPIYDAPETTAFFDGKTRTLFSSDFCGAVLAAPAEAALDVAAPALRDGMTLWRTIDAPWLTSVASDVLDAALAQVRGLAPSLILSTHLPPALGMSDVLFDNVRAARTASPFVGPDQQQFSAMLAAERRPAVEAA